jgi:hypothetical protein
MNGIRSQSLTGRNAGQGRRRFRVHRHNRHATYALLLCRCCTALLPTSLLLPTLDVGESGHINPTPSHGAKTVDGNNDGCASGNVKAGTAGSAGMIRGAVSHPLTSALDHDTAASAA